MRILHLLLGICATFSLRVAAQAAQCCGTKGDSFDEEKLWGLRAILCNDTLGQKESAGSRVVETTFVLGNLHATYAFWAHTKDGSQSFDHCWEATQALIEQCFRSGQAAGSWQHNAEFYAMTATDGLQHTRRDNFSVADLPPLPSSSSGIIQDIVLENGTYNILGVPVRLGISGVDLSPMGRTARRARAPSVLRTIEGDEVTNFTIIARPAINLTAIVHQAVSDLLGQSSDGTARQNSLAKRAQVCQTSKQYVMVEYGKFAGRHVPYTILRGSGGWIQVNDAFTFTETFSTEVDASLADAIAAAASSAGYNWERSRTTGDLGRCTWSKGACHLVSVYQHMAYQTGFTLDAHVLPSSDSATSPPLVIDLKLIHSQAPDGRAVLHCDYGCCAPIYEKRFGRYWDHCKYAAGKECYYGTCTKWDEDCNGVGQTC